MEYDRYNLEELQNTLDKGQNLEELNKIIGIIVDKKQVLYDDNEETNNFLSEKEIYQEMKLINLEDLDAIHLEEIKRKVD